MSPKFDTTIQDEHLQRSTYYLFSPMFLISEAANLPDSSPSFKMILSPPSRDVWSDHDALGSGNADMVLKMVSGSPATPSTAPVSERSNG